MELDNIVGCLKQITAPHLLRFVSEKGENSCEQCKKYHNLIFEENDKNIPKIPIHPNCRCKFEHVKNDELEKIKENIEKLSKQIDYWAKQILSHGNQLLRDVDTIMLKVESVKKSVEFKKLSLKITATVTALQYTITAAEKIKLAEETLRTESSKLQIKINSWSEEVKSLATAIPDYIAAMKKIHYPRLNDADQQPQNLPQSPEEAIKRGFTKATPNENWYHRGKGQIDNEKYYHKITGQEVVFDKNGKIVTDPENIGTRNYGPIPKSSDHIWLDVIPYYIWGNSPDDTTPLLRRIWGYH